MSPKLHISEMKRLVSDAIQPLAIAKWYRVSETGDDPAPDWRAMLAVALRWIEAGKPVLIRRFDCDDGAGRFAGSALWTRSHADQRAYLAEVAAEPLRPSITRVPSLLIERDPEGQPSVIWPTAVEDLLGGLAESWWPGWVVRVFRPGARVRSPLGACRHDLALATDEGPEVWTLVATMPA